MTNLTEREAADRLGVSLHTLRAWRRYSRRGGSRGPSWLQMGRTVRYRPADLDAYERDVLQMVSTSRPEVLGSEDK